MQMGNKEKEYIKKTIKSTHHEERIVSCNVMECTVIYLDVVNGVDNTKPRACEMHFRLKSSIKYKRQEDKNHVHT